MNDEVLSTIIKFKQRIYERCIFLSVGVKIKKTHLVHFFAVIADLRFT